MASRVSRGRIAPRLSNAARPAGAGVGGETGAPGGMADRRAVVDASLCVGNFAEILVWFRQFNDLIAYCYDGRLPLDAARLQGGDC